MAAKRDALADELSTLASDFRSLLDTLVHDPKAQAWKERRWRALLAVTSFVYMLGARRAAAKTWSILTGEQPPGKGRAPARDEGRAAAAEGAGPAAAERAEREPETAV